MRPEAEGRLPTCRRITSIPLLLPQAVSTKMPHTSFPPVDLWVLVRGSVMVWVSVRLRVREAEGGDGVGIVEGGDALGERDGRRARRKRQPGHASGSQSRMAWG